MGVISQAPELLECEIRITLFSYPRDKCSRHRIVPKLTSHKGYGGCRTGAACSSI
jgi:hypothetical protein